MKKLTTKLPGGLELRWPSVAVLAILCATLVAVWLTASSDERTQVLAGAAALIALVVQAFMRRVIGQQPPAPSDAVSDGTPTTRTRKTTGAFTALPRLALALLAIGLTGCGAGTMATLTTVAAAAKPVGVMLCLAARETTRVCERVGAFGPPPDPAPATCAVAPPAPAEPASSGGEDEIQ